MSVKNILRLKAIGGAVLLLFSASPVFAQQTQQICQRTDQSTEQVIPRVVLTWDSSFHCRNAPNAGEYMIVVRVFNASTSAEAVEIQNLVLTHTTPRPRGKAPAATAIASGLPITVAPGDTEDFTVTGDYALVKTDEGNKANLHLRAGGVGLTSDEDFALGINVLIRAPRGLRTSPSRPRAGIDVW
ncbi:MAG: hypothetical protein ACT4QB_22420 [Gammaproteobacteria bacterium]